MLADAYGSVFEINNALEITTIEAAGRQLDQGLRLVAVLLQTRLKGAVTKLCRP